MLAVPQQLVPGTMAGSSTNSLSLCILTRSNLNFFPPLTFYLLPCSRRHPCQLGDGSPLLPPFVLLPIFETDGLHSPPSSSAPPCVVAW